MSRSILAVLLVLFTFEIGHAGWLDDAVKSVGEGIGRRAVGDAGSGAYEGAKDAAKDAVNGTGKPAENQPASGAAANRSGSAPETMPSAGVPIEQAETVYSKYDFIPGDKMIFFDDFSDTDVGEFPRKWTLKGPAGGGNTVEVVDYKGKRLLRSVPPSSKNDGIPASTLYVRLNTKGDMPEKFTIEFDAVLGKPNGYQNQYYLLMYDESGWPTHALGTIYISGDRSQSKNTTTSIDKSDGKVHHVAVSVNGTFVKAYVDNQRVVNDPDAITRPLKYIGISLHANHGYSDTIMFTNFRLAEGGKDIKSALNTEGKIVTHGILFDTGSDTIKPESLPTLKMILGLLNDDPGLKFSIEGHTDNQGNKGINQPLSEKRAAAVKTWLAGKGIADARLKTKGFGDTKPIASNDTPEGRANNRRVEFVKF
jgi:outer membrane protein OmpA-like peptidoglycan-associated protein